MKPTLYDSAIGAAWRHFPSLVLFSFLINILLLVSTIYMLQVYDRVLTTGSFDTLLWLTVGALAAIFIYGMLEHARGLPGCNRVTLSHVPSNIAVVRLSERFGFRHTGAVDEDGELEMRLDLA